MAEQSDQNSGDDLPEVRQPRQNSARRLLSVLRHPLSADEKLDERIPEYVVAELAGEDVATNFPDVHAYILSNDDANELYSILLDEELMARGELPEPSQPVSLLSFQPDLSFLKDPLSQPAPSLRQRIVDWAQRLAKALRPKDDIHIEDFVEPFFDFRFARPDVITLQPGGANPFGAVGGDVPEELRWLEAVYQFTKLRQPSGDRAQATQAALTAAANAGLPKTVQKQFAELIVTWDDV